MKVSWNGGSRKSSIWIGFAVINQSFGCILGIPHWWKHPNNMFPHFFSRFGPSSPFWGDRGRAAQSHATSGDFTAGWYCGWTWEGWHPIVVQTTYQLDFFHPQHHSNWGLVWLVEKMKTYPPSNMAEITGRSSVDAPFAEDFPLSRLMNYWRVPNKQGCKQETG